MWHATIKSLSNNFKRKNVDGRNNIPCTDGWYFSHSDSGLPKAVQNADSAMEREVNWNNCFLRILQAANAQRSRDAPRSVPLQNVALYESDLTQPEAMLLLPRSQHERPSPSLRNLHFNALRQHESLFARRPMPTGPQHSRGLLPPREVQIKVLPDLPGQHQSLPVRRNVRLCASRR